MRDLGVGQVGGLFMELTTGEQASEGPAELDGHGVVEDGVDCTVHVDHDATEEQEPQVGVALGGERVVDDEDTVGHPQGSEEDHHHGQHLDDLQVESQERGLKVYISETSSSRPKAESVWSNDGKKSLDRQNKVQYRKSGFPCVLM